MKRNKSKETVPETKALNVIFVDGGATEDAVLAEKFVDASVSI